MMKRIQWLISAVALAAACGDGSNVIGDRPDTSSDSGTPVNPTVDGGTPTNDSSAQPDSPITPPPVDASVTDDAPPLPVDAGGPNPCERPTCGAQTVNLSNGFRADRVQIDCTMTSEGLSFAIEPYGLRGVAHCTGQMNTCTADTVVDVIDDEGVSHRTPAIFESNRDMSGATCSSRANITVRLSMTGRVVATGTSDTL